MISALNEVSGLRNDLPLLIDYKNSNRYRIVTVEPDGNKTAYYFSTPIYNNKTRKALDMKFHLNNDAIYSIGSNADIKISNAVRIENSEGACILSLSENATFVSEHELACGNERIFTTTNGVAYRVPYKNNIPFTITIEVTKSFMEIRANDKYFALMSERFRPFALISCIGTVDMNGDIIAPAKVEYQKITDTKYSLSFYSSSAIGKWILFEVNLYEPKLFQDTTVESGHPKLNNAFGGVGFIGTTEEYGEQWLYSRLDLSKLSELNEKKIVKAVLHLPKLNTALFDMSAYSASTRFCSFGSTWENKIAAGFDIGNSITKGRYIDIDITSIVSDKYGKLERNEGFILKAKKKDAGFSVIATGDSHMNPQILEIMYRQ